jgi:two-component system response regulator NreC
MATPETKVRTMPEQEQGQDATTIVLADDHAVVRSALRMLLESEPEFEVVAEAGDAPSAIRYVRGHKPTVLILDLNMPGPSSLEAIPEIKEASPDTQIVVLTMQAETAFARQALQAGVVGYVLKEAADDELVNAVRSAALGQTYLQPAWGHGSQPSPRPAPSTTSASAGSNRGDRRLADHAGLVRKR